MFRQFLRGSAASPLLAQAFADTDEMLRMNERMFEAVANAFLSGSEPGLNIEYLDEDVNVAVAVHRPEGLVAPVIRGADKLAVEEISQRIADLTVKVVKGRLSVSDVTGGTFTVSNLGEVGVELFAPVINPPHAGILAVGTISKRPVAADDTVEVRNVATLSLVFDHRVVDGVPAGRFLGEVKGLLENPRSLVR